jgi:predicted amidohydrolase
MRAVSVASIQLAVPGWDREANLAEAERLVREAAAQGAQVILLPELFELPYFCTEQDAKHFRHALPYEGHPAITRFSRVAAETAPAASKAVTSSSVITACRSSPISTASRCRKRGATSLQSCFIVSISMPSQ